MPLRFVVIPTSHADVRTMLASYYREISQRHGFNVSGQAAAEDMDPPGGRFVVAYDGESPVASGGIRTWEPGVCEIKRMFVKPEARRLGYGRELLATLERTARDAGFRRVVLDTIATQIDSARFYEMTGYQRVPAYNENPYAGAWFAKEL